MTEPTRDRRDRAAASGGQLVLSPLYVGASTLLLASIGLSCAAQAQYFDNRPTISRGATETVGPGESSADACPRWLDDPTVRQALQEAEAALRQEYTNQFALSKLMNAPALRNRELLANKAKDKVSETVFRIYLQRSQSIGRRQEAGEFADVIRRMPLDQVSTCLPRIAGLLSEEEGRIAGSDKAEADRRAGERTPSGRLVIVYRSYAAVRECLRSRAGRLLTYLTETDVEEAKGQAKAIEQRVTRENPALDLDAIWAKAVKPEAVPDDLLGMFANLDLVGRHDVEAGDLTENGRAYCQQARRSVEENYREVFPEDAARKKDF